MFIMNTKVRAKYEVFFSSLQVKRQNISKIKNKTKNVTKVSNTLNKNIVQIDKIITE